MYIKKICSLLLLFLHAHLFCADQSSQHILPIHIENRSAIRRAVAKCPDCTKFAKHCVKEWYLELTPGYRDCCILGSCGISSCTCLLEGPLLKYSGPIALLSCLICFAVPEVEVNIKRPIEAALREWVKEPRSLDMKDE